MNYAAVTQVAVPAISKCVSLLVETWLKPKLDKFIVHQEAEKLVMEHSLENKFQEYLERAYKRHSYMTTVVFQNQQKLLTDLYLPLHVELVVEHKEAATKNLDVEIDSFRKDFLPKYERVLLTDTAGMGKSTILRFLFLKCVEENAGVPIFVDLRNLSKEKTVLDFLFQELNPLDEVLNRDFVLQLVKRGDFVFFLDGYDEIATDQKQSVTKDLQDFISKAGNNLYIISSRPEQALVSFNNFQNFTIRPLVISEAQSLIRLYAGDNPSGEQLIAKLEEATSKNVHEFLTNPLLVSLLYRSYEYKPTLPLKKSIFYRQVYDALYDTHDLSKDGSFIRTKFSGLDSDDFNRILRSLGFLMFKDEKISDNKDAWLKFITQAKDRCPGLIFQPSDFLNDLTNTVPLVVREGEDYKWSHRSIQEYFAAQFVCVDAKEQQSLLLRRFVSSKNITRCYNVLDLCYDIDYRTFQRTIIYDLVCAYIKFCEDDSPDKLTPNAQLDSLNQRYSLCFFREYVYYTNEYLKKNRQSILDPKHPKGTQHLSFLELVRHADEKEHSLSWKTESVSVSRNQYVFGNLLVYTMVQFNLLKLLWEKRDAIVEAAKPCKKNTDTQQTLLAQTLSSISTDGALVINKKKLVAPSESPEQIRLVNCVLVGSIHIGNVPALCLNLKKCLVLKTKLEQILARENDNSLVDGF